MDRAKAREQATEATELAKRVHHLFAGHDPGVQGAAIADLAATWLAGHPREIRVAVLREWLKLVARVTEIEAERLRTD